MAGRARVIIGGAAALLLVSSGAALAAFPAEPDVPSSPSVPSVSPPQTAKLGTEAEAWYQLTKVSTCNSPVGCLPASVPAAPALPDLPVDPSVFPANTLHIGWAAGVELARSYIKLDTSSLPKGAQLTGGTLTVPLISDPTQGTLQPTESGIRTCLVTSPITDGVAGSLSAAPGIDCSVSSPLEADGSSFTVDLTPFVQAWSSGTPDEGLAFTPFSSSSVESAWLVAVPGRNAAGLPHIEADLDYVVPQAAVPPAVIPAQPATSVVPPAAPVQAVVPPAAAPVAQVPAAAVPAVKPTELASKVSAFGWAVFGLGVITLLGLGFAATQRPDPIG